VYEGRKGGGREVEECDGTYDVLVGNDVDAKLDLSKLPMTDCVPDSIRIEHAPLWMGGVAGLDDLGRLEDGRRGGRVGCKYGG